MLPFQSIQDTSIARRGLLLGGLGLAAGALPARAQTAGGPPSAVAAPLPETIVRRIGKTGESVPALGLGTFLTFDVLPGQPREHLREIIKRYWEGGARVLDTSPLYGTGETSVGDFLTGLGINQQVFLANKIWSTGEYLADESHARRSLEQSQQRLWRQSFDLLQCHSLVNVDVVLPILAAWKKEGRVRYVGVTHHENTYHELLAQWIDKGVVDFVQVNYSIHNRSAEERVFAAAQNRGVGVFVNMAMEKARLHKVVGNSPLPDFAREIGVENWAQFFLKFVMSHPAVTCCLSSTSNPVHAAQNVGALRGPLPDRAMRERMIQHMQAVPGFAELGKMPWYPDKRYPGIIGRSQADIRARGSGMKTRQIAVALALLAWTSSPLAQPSMQPVGRFEIDRTEVTVGEFRRYVEATAAVTAAERAGGGSTFENGWEQRPGWTWKAPFGRAAGPSEPAVHVTYGEAEAYCKWAGKRLPTDAEWGEAAYTERRDPPPAGFATGRSYPYPTGDSPIGANCLGDCGAARVVPGAITSRGRGHAEAGATRAGVNGLHDMGGNVWEWVDSGPSTSKRTRGGSWWYGAASMRDEHRQEKPADTAVVYIGFRCARSR